jgi:hypothetical protein
MMTRCSCDKHENPQASSSQVFVYFISVLLVMEGYCGWVLGLYRSSLGTLKANTSVEDLDLEE